MKIYRYFIYKLILIAIFSFILYGFMVYFFYKTPISTIWINKVINQKTELAEKEKKKKIVFIGGSNVHYGITTSIIQEQTNIPSFNLGSHAGLQIDYILHYAKKTLSKGDIVIAPLEYSHIIWNDENIELTRRDYILTWDREFFNNLSILKQIKMIYSVSPIYFLKSMYQATKNADDFYHNTLNSNGDETSIHNKIIDTTGAVIEYQNSFHPSYGVNKIIEFTKWCKKNRIDFYYTFPNHTFNKEHDNSIIKNFLFDFISYLRINNVNILGNPYQSFYKEDLFYDSRYHLNSEGRVIRTNDMLNLIKTNGILNE